MKLYISSCRVIAKVLRIISATILLSGLYSINAISAQPDRTSTQGTSASTELKAVTTSRSSLNPMAPRHSLVPIEDGFIGNDISATVPVGHHISKAIGSFDAVNNVNSVTTTVSGSGSVLDAYSLQLNTNFFATDMCPEFQVDCRGWIQFIYKNGGLNLITEVYIQYWLIRYSNDVSDSCPPLWTKYEPGGMGIDCYYSNLKTTVPNHGITNLLELSLAGSINLDGTHSVVFSDGVIPPWSAVGDNAVQAETDAWEIAEFNVFGYNSSPTGDEEATFQATTDGVLTIQPRTTISYGGTMAPDCVVNSFTNETNNLGFPPVVPSVSPDGDPALVFIESLGGAETANCMFARAVGDTHLMTFEGLLYDFQASGDFILAQIDPGFVVQARKVSGEPRWPNTSVNKAVATRMGKTDVALCLTPPGREKKAILKINGKPTDLDDGELLSLPGGADVLRKANVYLIKGRTSGNSVRAVAHNDHMNISVGLGRWPTKVRGLLANAEGNVNQLETRDGEVLKKPFSFKGLYHLYGDSWRAREEESLLSVCGTENVDRGNPSEPFYANDLNEEEYEGAREVCKKAGVKEGPLFEACVLDVVVIDDDTAAEVFVGVPAPIAEGILVFTTSDDIWQGYIPWFLLLVLIAFNLWFFIRKRLKTP